MKKISFMFLFVIIIFCLTFFCSCKSNDKELYVKGLTDVEICVNNTNFDFNKGVSCVDKSGNEVVFSVEKSKIDFTKAGEYKAEYYFDGVTKNRLVKIYDKPKILSSNVDITFPEINTIDYDFSKKVEAIDSFGEKVQVYMNQEFPRTKQGTICSGNYEVEFKAVDKLNNETIKKLNVTLQNSTKYPQLEINVDYSNAYKTFKDVSNIIDIVCDGNSCSTDSYYYANNSLIILPKLIRSIGIGTHDIFILFYDGYINTKLNVTDKEDFNVSYGEGIDGNSYLQLDTIELPLVKKAASSIQNFEVKNYIKVPSALDKVDVINASYKLNEWGDYTFYSEIISDGMVKKEVVQHFTVESILPMLKSNLIDKDIISKNIFSKQFEDNKYIEYYDQGEMKDITTDAIVLNSSMLPKESDVQHYFGISEEYIDKAKLMNCVKIELKMYTKCGFAIYDLNAKNSSLSLVSYVAESDDVIKKDLIIDISNINNSLVLDTFGKSSNGEIIITEIKFLDENGVFTNINGNLVERPILDYITGTKATIYYEENVNLGGTICNAIHVHAENTNISGWTKTNYIDLQKLYTLHGEKTKIFIKVYAKCENCEIGFFDSFDNGKGLVGCSNKFETRSLLLSDACFISLANGDTVDLYIVDIRFEEE